MVIGMSRDEKSFKKKYRVREIKTNNTISTF